jgi:hypothetical protein
VYRGSGWDNNYPVLYNDIAAAYQNALRYHISGDTAHGDCARDICNAWSSTLTLLNGSADRFLLAARGHPGGHGAPGPGMRDLG